MELRYRRKIKMPIYSLPGFADENVKTPGTVGTSFTFGDLLGKDQNGNNLTISDLWPDGTPGSKTDIHKILEPYESNPISAPSSIRAAVLPKNKTSGGGGGANIAGAAINFIGSGINSFGLVKGSNELYADAGLSTSYGPGYSWTRQNAIDGHAEMQELKLENTSNTLKTMGAGAGLGAAVGSVIPGLGTVAGGAIGAGVGLITGIFGSNHRKRKLRRAIYNAQLNITRRNTWSNAAAQTDYMSRNYYTDNPYTLDDVLYSAKTGKTPGDWQLPAKTMKGKVREFNRKLTLPDMK